MSTKDIFIIRSTEQLAKALNFIEEAHDNLKYRCDENPNRYSSLLYQLDDASARLGYALATLVGWVDDEVEGTDE